ncbi:RNA helicase, partial [Ceratobasidium sp. 395]
MLPRLAARSIGRSIHTSGVILARPKHGAGRRGARFIPARARLAEDHRGSPRSNNETPRAPSSRTRTDSVTRHHETPTVSNTSPKLKKTRPRERELIMDLPAPNPASKSTREPAPHLSRPTRPFYSPPLLPGLVDQIRILLGTKAKPSPIQALSLDHFFANNRVVPHEETLLAAETGSGKSLAYLLP